MRVQRLDLLRYGCFTDVSVEFPVHQPDIHIVFGPNEAGKSTALLAIEDLLFGIPHNSPLNFSHDYAAMRIGALLQNSGEMLEIRRRKGTRDTLLTAHETPLPAGEGALTPYLAGADRNFFVRMFSLDHQRLRQGGREILEAQDEVGQILFSVGAGISGLRHRLAALVEEADALWASRRAARRRYYQAEERLQEAEKALREHTVTATKWHELRRAHEAAQEAYTELELNIENKSAELGKLGRIRRVYRYVRKKTDLDERVAALGKVPPLPEDAQQILEEAERAEGNAEAGISALTEQLERARKERAALTCDETLLLRADDIQELHERRIQVQAGKADLPKRQAELASAESELRRLANELEWDAADIEQLVGRIPSRAKVADIRAALNRRGGCLSGLQRAKVALQEAEDTVNEIQQRLEGMGPTPDVSKLVAVIKATHKIGDIASLMRSTEAELNKAQASVQRGLMLLKPEITDEASLAIMRVPPRDTVQAHRDRCRDLERRIQECRQRIRVAEQEKVRHQQAQERIAREEDAVAPEELERVRQNRDAGWSLVRRQYIDRVSVPDEEVRAFAKEDNDLPSAFEAAVRAADDIADRRFEKAEGAARLAELTRLIGEQEDLLDGLRQDEQALAEEDQHLGAAWQDMWAGAPFRPLSADAMLEWMEARDEVLKAGQQRSEAERTLMALQREEAETKARLLQELETLGVEIGNLRGEPLRIVLEAASNIQHQHETKAEARRQLQENLSNAASDAQRKRRQLEEAERAWSDWESQWAEALVPLGLTAATRADSVAEQVDVVDRMREILVKVNELRHERIGKIGRDVAAFGRDVLELANALAPDVDGTKPEPAVIEIERRLADARRISDLQKRRDEDIASLEARVKGLENTRRQAREALRHLQETAGCENIDQVRAAIQKCDEVRFLQAELSQVLDTLAQEGDGFSYAELQEECSAIDVDKIAAREESLGQELKDLRSRLIGVAEQCTQARQAFEAIGGNDAAARASANRQEAIAEMRDVAEQYVRVRSAATLLQWAIDRYRREKQAPLLKHAGELFATLTGGSFSDLRVDFDEQDRAHLIGVRPDGSTVGVPGMSTATADQLYLALRIASIEDYLDRAAALPFIADDLFVNFDDERATAGFKVLDRLASRTQVLFFTHHRHLVDIACSTLTASVPVITLIKGG